MSVTEIPDRYFTWRRYAVTLLVQLIVVGLLELYWFRSSGGWNSSSLAVLPVLLWINLAYVYQWRQLIRQEAEGKLSQRDYQADPLRYLKGSPSQWRFTVIGGAVVALVFVLVTMIW